MKITSSSSGFCPVKQLFPTKEQVNPFKTTCCVFPLLEEDQRTVPKHVWTGLDCWCWTLPGNWRGQAADCMDHWLPHQQTTVCEVPRECVCSTAAPQGMILSPFVFSLLYKLQTSGTQTMAPTEVLRWYRMRTTRNIKLLEKFCIPWNCTSLENTSVYYTEF